MKYGTVITAVLYYKNLQSKYHEPLKRMESSRSWRLCIIQHPSNLKEF